MLSADTSFTPAFVLPPLPPLSTISPGVSEETKLSEAPAEIVTSPTGGQKGKKLAQFSLIPTGPLTALAELYGRGALKYSADNWRKGYPWSLAYAAMMRHANAFRAGQNRDPETGALHIIAVAWHAFTLAYFIARFPQYDDRPKDIDTE
ncbi:DUF5664 domain-containing protein [Nocardia vinacea]|uniref:DUF5664 domain-containing protein n=1 Tax=Nocardia vinacea TaxID=96468 RepID=A0ABZ1YI79_9NOCA|nr:dATP/dGTP diphosphohydrolase domain-containing protein [Nocardia vinacea]